MLRLAFRPAERSHIREREPMKSLVSTYAEASFAIPLDVSIGIVALALLIMHVVATALGSCDSEKRSEAALAVLRILLRTLISVCILLYWLRR